MEKNQLDFAFLRELKKSVVGSEQALHTFNMLVHWLIIVIE